MSKQVVVIGAGAAGMMAAISAARNGNKVTVVEKNTRPGRKIMITGKGRCNVTNNCDNSTLIKNVTKNGKFLYSAFSAFSSSDTMDFFESLGVPLKTERGARVFPESDRSVDIVDALHNECRRSGVKIICDSAEHVEIYNSTVSDVICSSGEKIPCDAVVIATGGYSYPLTGSTGDGHRIAKECGHTVTEIVPSLVPLKIREGFCTKLMGLTLKNVRFSVFEGNNSKPIYSEMGELIFTHFGISGPLVLSASAHMRKMGVAEYTATIDLKPALDTATLDKRIQRDFSENSGKILINSLNAMLPKSLIPVVVSLAHIDQNTGVSQITKQQRAALCDVLKGIKLHVEGFRDIEEAIVTSGGVDVREINPKTMESKKVKGLYFAGEIIDVDAYTGGFNLQIAFSTGNLAGGSI